MNTILEWFWLLCALWVGVVNAAFFRYRLREAIDEGAISRKEADRFAVGTCAWVGGSCLVFWALQQLADSPSPDFLTWATPYDHIARSVCVALWVVSFFWIWFFGGDRKLARIFALARYQAYMWKHPIAFRIVIVLVIAGGVIGMTMHQRIS
jgi:hypothetical protein